MPGDKKNLVLGTAIGYGVPEISIFIKSFREYNRIDEVMLVVDSSISIDVINFCIAHNIKYTPFEAYKFIPTHIQNSRYIKYLEILLDNIMRYDKVFLSDVRDVVFQGDIFDDLPEQFLYYFMEYEHDTIGNNAFNAEFIKRNYGNEVFELLKDANIFCSGTTLGDFNSILHYLFSLLAQRDCAKFMELTREADEQGPHNYLFHFGNLRITPKANGDIVGTLGATASANPSAITRDGGRYIVNGRCPKVLHQYDRCAEIYDHFLKRYLGMGS